MVSPVPLDPDTHAPRRSAREQFWREWCFLKAVVRQRGRSALLLLIILFGGGVLFQTLEPDKHHSYPEAVFCTWSLIFAQPPESLPDSWVLRSLFFLVPIPGLSVLLEAVIAVSRMIRDRQAYEQSWCRIMANSMSDHVILIGLGRLGYRTFRLLRSLGERVVVIEVNPQNQFLEDIRRDGSPLIIGDARRESLLETAGIATARSVIACTTNDLANLEIVLDARRFRPDIRVVCRMFDQNMADKVRHGFNIQYAMSQAMISAPAFAMAAVRLSVVGSCILDDQLIVTVRAAVSPRGPLDGLTVGEILERHGLSILKRLSDQPALFPGPSTRVAPGDELLLQGPFETLARLDLAAPPAPG